jgi:hypothetical protein
MHHFRKISYAYESVKTGEEPDDPIHLVSLPFLCLYFFLLHCFWQYNCPRLKNAVQEFALWDEFSLDNMIFPELPRQLIEVCTQKDSFNKIRADLREKKSKVFSDSPSTERHP